MVTPPLLALLVLACATDKDGDGGDGTDTACTPTDWYADQDGDGYGAGSPTAACQAPSGHVATTGDCDDSAADIHPGAEEVCNDLDDDCDFQVDPPELFPQLTCFRDADGDGFGTTAASLTDCACPDGYVLDATDCEDADPDAWPGAAELWYDGVDQDCAGGDDFDADGDGSGVDGDPVDCDDNNPDIHPEAEELCGNGIDDDCDGQPGDCGLTGTISSEWADLDVLAEDDYTDWVLGTASDDLDGDGAPEVLLSRRGRVTTDQDHLHEYHLVSLAARGATDLAGISVAALVVPTGTDRWTASGNGRADADLDGDGHADYILGAGNMDFGDSNPPGRIFLAHGPAAGRVDLTTESSAMLSEDQIGFWVPALLESGEGGPFVIGAQIFDMEPESAKAMVFLSGAHFSGEADPDDAPALWEDGTVELRTSYSNTAGRDIDGDGLGDLFGTIRTTPDGRSSRPAVFLGPFDADRHTDEADATFEEDDPDGMDEDAAVCTAATGGAVLVLRRYGGDLDATEHPYRHDMFAWEGPGSYEPGDAQVRLLDRLETASWAVSCGGDVDGDGREELAMATDGGGYHSHAVDSWLAMIELPDSGTWETPDLTEFFVSHPASDHSGAITPLLGTDVDGDGTDDLLYTSSYRSIADDHKFERYRTRLLVYRGERPGL